MSIGALAIGEAAIAAQSGPNANSDQQGGKPPPKRVIVAAADVVVAPEPR